jgi:hypothetical protein
MPICQHVCSYIATRGDRRSAGCNAQIPFLVRILALAEWPQKQGAMQVSSPRQPLTTMLLPFSALENDGQPQ